jgi:ABC-type dipeptide/oligopeptide/nickel transport systems, permease components
VKSLVFSRAPRTLLLIVGAAFLWLVVGVAIGVLSAVKRRTVVDRVAMGFALFGISTPVFWLGLMGSTSSGASSTGRPAPATSPRSTTPRVLLAHDPALERARAALRGVLRADDAQQPARDVRRGLHPNARAKGLSERTVIFKHGLRASLTPIVTMFGMDIALLVGGAVITESVFNIQGLGYLAINDALQQDLPVVLGVVLIASVAVALASLVVDILYAFIDPRVRYA